MKGCGQMANRKMAFLDVGLTSQFISVVFLLKYKTTFVKYYHLWAVMGQSIPFRLIGVVH